MSFYVVEGSAISFATRATELNLIKLETTKPF